MCGVLPSNTAYAEAMLLDQYMRTLIILNIRGDGIYEILIPCSLVLIRELGR